MSDEREEDAIELFINNFNCSQAVFQTFANDFGLNPELASKISTAFGGGIARNQFTCGAITGAAMVIGLKYGQSTSENAGNKKLTYQKTNEFITKFVKLHGLTNCRELIGADFSDPIDYQRAIDENLFEKRCNCFVKDAVKILEEDILKE